MTTQPVPPENEPVSPVPTTAPDNGRDRRSSSNSLIVMTAIYAFIIIYNFPQFFGVGGLAAMAGTSTGRTGLGTLGMLLMAAPFVIVGALIAAWIAWAMRRYKMALLFANAPLLLILVMLIITMTGL